MNNILSILKNIFDFLRLLKNTQIFYSYLFPFPLLVIDYRYIESLIEIACQLINGKRNPDDFLSCTVYNVQCTLLDYTQYTGVSLHNTNT